MKKPKNPNYEVGYAKPPEHSKFKPGQSGNPSGRPKGSFSVSIAFNRALRERVVVVENGKRKSITKLDAIAKGITNSAVKGDAKARSQVLSQGLLIGVETTSSISVLDIDDAAVMAALADRFAKTVPDAVPKAKATKRSFRPIPKSNPKGGKS